MANESDSKPLGRIGLCLSGGGYRATAFHLGILDLFNQAGLLPDVVGLSTVSGGTFAGARWALSLANGESFADFFTSLSRFLETHDCINDALAGMKTAGAGRPSGRCSLITAAASAYSHPDFMGSATFDRLFVAPTSLEHVIFNSTELNTGLDFRFQKSKGGLIGNGKWSIPEDAARQLRLADLVAASSCFPGGFEPLQFPQDFAWPQGKLPPLWSAAAATANPQGLALVDGGVYDNMGLSALLLADTRGTDRRNFDLFFLSDVDQRSDKAFFAFSPPVRMGWLRFNGIVAALLLWSLLNFASAAQLLVRYFSRTGSWLDQLFPVLVLLLCAIGPWMAALWVRARIPPEFRGKVQYLWSYLAHQKVAAGVELASLRIQSLIAIASDVFMKRIRDLGLRVMYSSPDLKDRTVAAFIYDLPQATSGGGSAYPAELLPSPSQLKQAEIANAVPTQLWFDDQSQLPALIATGRSTACFSLIDHLQRSADENKRPPTPAEANLLTRLRALWQQLQQP